MKPQLLQARDLYVEMRALYEKGLEVGEQVWSCPEEQWEDLADQRHRLLTRIGNIRAELYRLVAESGELTAAEWAFLDEAQKLVTDLKPKYAEQALRMDRFFDKKTREERRDIVSVNKKSNAAMAYMAFR